MDVRVGLSRKLSTKNWCFWTVVLEKTLEISLDCKEIQPVHPKGDQSWVFIGRTDAEAETPILRPPHAKSWLMERPWCWKGLGAGGEGVDRWWWHHWLDGHVSEWTLGVGDGQGGLVCRDSWGRKESDTTERVNWTEVKENLTVLKKKIQILQDLKEWAEEF